MKTVRCPDCGYASDDPEVMFAHMMTRECQRRPVTQLVPEWVRRAREKRLPAKEWMA